MIEIGPLKREVRLWRPNLSRYDPKFVVKTNQSGRKSIMFWAGISAYGKTELIQCPKPYNADAYKDFILRPYALAAMDALNCTIFIQDNAPLHKAKKVMECFGNRNIQLLDWPPCSPDLNPIENLWAILKKRITSKINIFSTIEEVSIVAKNEWKNISNDMLVNLVSSMPTRLRKCQENNYGSTKY